jgi:hypothetical protein
MCEGGGHGHDHGDPRDRPRLLEDDRGHRLTAVGLDRVLDVARFVAAEPEVRRTAAGFIGYGATAPGDRVLIAIDREYDPRIPDAVARALREKGARVDVITVDIGDDEVFDELDEIRVIMRREPWDRDPRRWEGIPWIEEMALRNGYTLLIHGKGGGIPNTPHRYEAIPWLQLEQFVSRATTFPRDVHTLINEKVWSTFRERGRGGKVHLTDPEGTDLTYTLWGDYFDGTRRGYGQVPWWGHVMGHAPTPILPQEDATGVVAGTMNHFSRPFRPIRVILQDGRVESVEGGGGYGDAWRAMLAESREVQYPCFPRPGLFWLWEIAIGTNPKIQRPAAIHRHSSGGMEWERRRSGVIHAGFGTRWRGSEEVWAGEHRILYGHLHVHLMFSTLTITTTRGEDLRVIDKGHLTVLDDPEVRDRAASHGDPDAMLQEEWVPDIPGISSGGRYEEYARDPAAWIYRGLRVL